MKRFFLLLSTILIASSSLAQLPPYTAGIVIEPTTGTVLFEKNSKQPLPPASMTKMMTLLIVAEQVKKGAMRWDETANTSARASKMGGSQVYLKHNEQFAIKDLAAATMIHSANDAAMALAERVGGTAEAFVSIMNSRAKELGLKNTTYYTPHGLPGKGDHPDDLMSAEDLAKLGIELMKYPEMRQWALIQQAPFRGGVFTMYNPNHLLRKFPGATGLKTGYHGGAGFCVTASAKRGNMELVSVVMGSTKDGSFDNAAQIMTEAFNNYEFAEPIKKGARVQKTVPVTDGKADAVAVMAGSTARMLIRRGEGGAVQTDVIANSVTAPVRAGQQVGFIVVKQGGKQVAKVPALAANAVEKAPWWRKFWPF